MSKKIGFLFPVCICLLMLGCTTGVPPGEVAEVYFNLGNSYTQQDRQSDAIKAYTKALEYDPTLFSAGYNLARVYLELGRYDEADAIIDDLLEKDGENTILLETRAWSCNLQGRTKEALEIYEGILELVPKHTNALFNAAVLHMEAGNTDRAYELLTNLYGYSPGDVEVLMRLGFIERERGDLEAASDLLEMCIAEEPANIECLVTLGDMYSERALFGDALEMYKKAGEVEASPELDFKRAFILLTAVEDYTGGMEALEEALENGFEDPEKIQELAEYPDLYKKEEILSFLQEKELYTLPEEE